MKKFVMALVLMAAAPMCVAYGNDTTGGDGTAKVRRASTTQNISGADGNVVTNNFYYTQSNRKKYRSSSNSAPKTKVVVKREVVSSSDYGAYDYETATREYNDSVQNYGTPARSSETANRTYGGDAAYAKSEKTTTKSYVRQERKFFLAHPFFQPLKGNFGSVTDFGWAKSSFKFDMLNLSVLDIDPNSSTYGSTIVPSTAINAGAKVETSQFLIKEDFSFGITDRVALIAMAQYDDTKVKLKDWSDGSAETKYSDSGLNVFGFGAQWRFLDTPKYIGMLAGYYEAQRDTADSLLADFKLGYKINRTTLYGVARAGYSHLRHGDIYGAYVEEKDGDWLMLSYKQDTKDVFYIEGGAGVFSVLNRYFTLNGEVFLGHYDWHNQLTLKGAFGFQPYDSFALNLYAMGVLYDSADGKTKGYMNYDQNPVDTNGNLYPTTLVYTTGDYKIKDYNEYKIGLQLIFHF